MENRRAGGSRSVPHSPGWRGEAVGFHGLDHPDRGLELTASLLLGTGEAALPQGLLGLDVAT